MLAVFHTHSGRCGTPGGSWTPAGWGHQGLSVGLQVEMRLFHSSSVMRCHVGARKRERIVPAWDLGRAVTLPILDRLKRNEQKIGPKRLNDLFEDLMQVWGKGSLSGPLTPISTMIAEEVRKNKDPTTYVLEGRTPCALDTEGR